MLTYCMQRRGRFENKKAVTCLFLEFQNSSDTHLYKILISVLGRIHIFVLSEYVTDPVWYRGSNSAMVFTCLDLCLESGPVDLRDWASYLTLMHEAFVENCEPPQQTAVKLFCFGSKQYIAGWKCTPQQDSRPLGQQTSSEERWDLRQDFVSSVAAWSGLFPHFHLPHCGRGSFQKSTLWVLPHKWLYHGHRSLFAKWRHLHAQVSYPTSIWRCRVCAETH